MNLLFRLFGKRFAAALAENKYRPKGFEGLSFAFTDTAGNHYYSWASVGDMPPNRIKNIEALMRQAEEGITRKDIDLIASEIKKASMDAIRAKGAEALAEAHSHIVVLADELTKRATGILPEDVFYDLAATCAIRQDETPGVIDRTIHLDKFAKFQEAGRAGYSFFTQLPTFKDLVSVSLTTEANFVKLLTNWSLTKQRVPAVLQVLSSTKKSGNITNNSSDSPTGLRGKMRPFTKR